MKNTQTYSASRTAPVQAWRASTPRAIGVFAGMAGERQCVMET